MSFVRLDSFSRCLIILSLCLYFQLATADSPEYRCYNSRNAKNEIIVIATSESSINVTWVLYDTSHKETIYNLRKNLTNLVTWYHPCYNESKTSPSLVQDPLTKVYLARYNIDESFYAWKNKSMSYPLYSTIFTNSKLTKSGITVDVTDLPFPDWTYVFYLERIMHDLSRESVRVVVQTHPALPKFCAGCFTIIETFPQEQTRSVRVYWRAVADVDPKRWHFRLELNKILPNHTSQPVHQYRILLSEGFVEHTIDMDTHSFEFVLLNANNYSESTRTKVVVPQQVNILHQEDPVISKTETNTSTDTHVLSWQKPKTFDAIEYYSLVWYDKEIWRKNQNCSPIMDWIYIPGNQTSIKLRLVDSKEDSDKRIGWRMSVHTITSSSGLQSFSESL